MKRLTAFYSIRQLLGAQFGFFTNGFEETNFRFQMHKMLLEPKQDL